MSIINTLREKMGRMLVVIVGLSILAFVLTDLVGSGSSLTGNSRDVGEIAGETISQEQFVNYVENIKNNYIQQGINPNERMMQTIRNQAWDQMIFDVVYADLYDEIGLAVTSDERVDMVQGRNISPIIMQYFSDPNTGQLDRAQLNNFLAQSSYDAQSRINWEITESQIAANRIRTKYDNLLLKTSYATLAEAQREYNSQLETVDIDYAYFPYFSVPDSAINISESEMSAYLRAHSDEYQVEQSRSLEFVTFAVTPSAADTATYEQEMADLKSRLEAAEDDSTFAILNTEQGVGFSTYGPGNLPDALKDNITSMKVGDVFGPTLTNGVYSLQKLSGIESGDTKFVKARHILIKTEGLTSGEKNASRVKADLLIRQLRSGSNFEQLARENSEDSSAPLGGDLGWYEENTGWDPEFEKAVFSRTRKGLIPRVVESQFGYHVISIDEVPTDRRYKVADVQVILTPSFDTRNAVYQQAAEFASNADSYQEFSDLANQEGYPIFSGDNISPDAISIGSLPEARSIVIWLFSEASRGEVKDFELEDSYIVAVHTDRVEEGTATLASVRDEIESKIRDQKKFDVLRQRIEGLSGTLQEIATAYGTQAKFYTTSALKLNTNSLPNVGTAPAAIGAAFALANPGDRTGVIDAETGVVVVELKARNQPAEIADYTTYENQIVQRISSQARFLLAQAIREMADVKDERYKFY